MIGTIDILYIMFLQHLIRPALIFVRQWKMLSSTNGTGPMPRGKTYRGLLSDWIFRMGQWLCGKTWTAWFSSSCFHLASSFQTSWKIACHRSLQSRASLAQKSCWRCPNCCLFWTFFVATNNRFSFWCFASSFVQGTHSSQGRAKAIAETPKKSRASGGQLWPTGSFFELQMCDLGWWWLSFEIAAPKGFGLGVNKKSCDSDAKSLKFVCRFRLQIGSYWHKLGSKVHVLGLLAMPHSEVLNGCCHDETPSFIQFRVLTHEHSNKHLILFDFCEMWKNI